MTATMANSLVIFTGVLCLSFTSTWACVGKFKYEILNQLKAPMFQHSMIMCILDPADPLIRYMETAVDTNKNFTKFTATYFATLGYYIEAINGVFSTYSVDKSYWYFLDGNTGKGLKVGVSTYKPMNNDHIIANLTIYNKWNDLL